MSVPWLWEELTRGSAVPYPELFWSWYTGSGSQAQTPKLWKVLISGVSFRHHSLSQSHESEVLSYSGFKIAKIFQGFAPRPHWRRLTAPPPRLPQLHNGFSPHYARRKTGTPKNCWHWSGPILTSNWTAELNTYSTLWLH